MIREIGSGARRGLTSAMARVRAERYARRPGRMTVGVGTRLAFDPGTADAHYARGDVELPVQEALAARLHPGGVFYDVGANVGFFTVIGARLGGATGRVVALEPVPANAALIRRNCDLNGFGGVLVIEQAASDSIGIGELILARHSGGAALSTASRPVDATTTIDVELTTIDALVDELALPPTLVKIDVEGAELAVLTGMADTLARHRPTIVCEIDDGDRRRYQEKHDECVDLLEESGYRITELADSYPGSTWSVGHFVADPIS